MEIGQQTICTTTGSTDPVSSDSWRSDCHCPEAGRATTNSTTGSTCHPTRPTTDHCPAAAATTTAATTTTRKYILLVFREC